MTPTLEGVRRGIRLISQGFIRQNQGKKQFGKMLFDVIRFTSLIDPSPTQSDGVYLVPFSYQFSWFDTKAVNLMKIY